MNNIFCYGCREQLDKDNFIELCNCNNNVGMCKQCLIDGINSNNPNPDHIIKCIQCRKYMDHPRKIIEYIDDVIVMRNNPKEYIIYDIYISFAYFIFTYALIISHPLIYYLFQIKQPYIISLFVYSIILILKFIDIYIIKNKNKITYISSKICNHILISMDFKLESLVIISSLMYLSIIENNYIYSLISTFLYSLLFKFNNKHIDYEKISRIAYHYYMMVNISLYMTLLIKNNDNLYIIYIFLLSLVLLYKYKRYINYHYIVKFLLIFLPLNIFYVADDIYINMYIIYDLLVKIYLFIYYVLPLTAHTITSFRYNHTLIDVELYDGYPISFWSEYIKRHNKNKGVLFSIEPVK